MVTDILKILKNDVDLKRLLQSTENDPRIYTNQANPSNNCILYSFIPLINDGVRMQSRFEVDCYSIDYAQCYEILKVIQKAIITLGDDSKTNNILTIVQNGGGYMFDKNIKMHMLKAIFTVNEKVRA